MRKKLHLVRHGETTRPGTYCGHTNPSLSPNGRRSVSDLAKSIADLPIDVCYCSSLLRAQETAQILCATRGNLSPILTPALMEINFGEWEGLPYNEIHLRFPEISRQWIADPTSVSIPRAEPFADFLVRVRRFLNTLSEERVENILIVAHGGTIAAIIMELQKRPSSDFFNLIPKLSTISSLEYGVVWQS